MPSLWQDDTRSDLRRRILALRADAPPRWGRFTAPQMLAHVNDALRMATGELPVAPRPTPWIIRHAPFKQLLLYVLPFPKGLPTAPELLARLPNITTGAWDRELASFEAGLEGFAARGRATPWPVHPAFGTLSARDWATLQYRHVDHHFRQFGA